MGNLYYVGFRESDICESPDFAGSITTYGSNQNTNISFISQRLNPFNHSKDLHNFYQTSMIEIIKKDPNAQFIFYNQEQSFSFNEEITSRTVGCNNYALIKLFNNRFFVRQFVQQTVDCPECYILNKKLLNSNTLKKIFATAKQLVFQEEGGSGGNTTYIFNKNNIKLSLLKNDYYLVSSFVENNIPYSIHVLVSDYDIYCFQPSIQIIKSGSKYYGADFAAIKYSSKDIIKRIKANAYLIGERLKNMGYRGIFGINFLASKENLYFLEINLRFMGSSLLLNKHLVARNFPTLQKLHFDACNKKPIDLTKYDFDEIPNMSNLIVFNGDIPPCTNVEQSIMDGYADHVLCENEAYLYTNIYYKSIIYQ